MTTLLAWLFRCGALCAFAAAVLFTPLVRAQATAVGSIEGRVLDAARGEYLPNARVTIEGTTHR